MDDLFCFFFKNQSRRGYGAEDDSYLETDDQDEEDVAGAEWEDSAKRWVNR